MNYLLHIGDHWWFIPLVSLGLIIVFLIVYTAFKPKKKKGYTSNLYNDKDKYHYGPDSDLDIDKGKTNYKLEEAAQNKKSELTEEEKELMRKYYKSMDLPLPNELK